MVDNNINDNNIIDVEYDDVENVIYLSAPQLAKKIGTTEATIRTWADVYGDLIGIEKINGRKTYKETQVSCFAFIKDLVENKNMKKTQVRNYISKHGFKYAEYNGGLVDPKDPLGFEVLASSLTVGVDKKLEEFKKEITNELLTEIKKYIILQGEAITEVLDNTILKVDEVVSEKLEENLEQVKTHITESSEATNQLHQDNKKILEELTISITEIKENEKKLAEILNNPETKENLIKSVKKESDGWISKLAKKFNK